MNNQYKINSNMLICNNCNKSEKETKIIKKKLLCINCDKRNYYEENKVKMKERDKDYRENNKEKIKDRKKKYYEENKEAVKVKSLEYYEENKEVVKIRVKEYRENNKEKCRKYIENNKDKRNKIRRDRTKNDPLFNLTNGIRNSIASSFRDSKYSKNINTTKILGCTFEDFKIYLESKFEYWMNWENKGLYNSELNYGWDVDHIIPISSAKTEEDVIKLNHYTNLQPLCSKINRDIKRDNF